MLGSMVCKMRGHRVNRRHVWDDGMNFRTNCARCDAVLIRDREGWRTFDNNRDLDERRRPHPRQD